MRGGCTEKMIRWRSPLGSSEGESDDACQPGPLECRAQIDFAVEKVHSIGIAGSVQDSPTGAEPGGRSAVREGPDHTWESEHRRPSVPRCHEKRQGRFHQCRGRSPEVSSPQPRGPSEERAWSQGRPVPFEAPRRNQQREEEEKWRLLALSGDDRANSCSSTDDKDDVDREGSPAQEDRTRSRTAPRVPTRAGDQVRFSLLRGRVRGGSCTQAEQQGQRVRATDHRAPPHSRFIEKGSHQKGGPG